MHERTKVRDFVINLLKDKTSAKFNVYNTKTTPWEADKLPAISVATPFENALLHSNSNIPYYDITLDLEITVAVKDDIDAAAELDNICFQIENELLENTDFTNSVSCISNFDTTINYKSEDALTVTAKILVKAIYKMIYEPRYKDNFKELSIRVMTPQTVVKSADIVIENNS